MSEYEWIFAEVGSGIRALIRKFVAAPFFFYREQDMHAYLYHKLVSARLGEFIVETHRGDRTILVHQEYPTLNTYRGPMEKASRGHFDLAIIDPVHALESDWRLTSKKPEYATHKPKVAVEFSLNEIGTPRFELEHYKKDLERLTDPNNAVDRGYLLFFVREEDFRGSRKFPKMITKLPVKLEEEFQKLGKRANNLAIVFVNSRIGGSPFEKVIPEDKSHWLK